MAELSRLCCPTALLILAVLIVIVYAAMIMSGRASDNAGEIENNL